VCRANKNINVKQCSVLWHINDIKVSHINTGIVTNVLKLFNDEHSKEAPLTVTRGKVHKYLGMTIDYNSEKVKVKITMIDYIQGMLDKLPSDMAGESATPAASHLFQVNEDAEKLEEKVRQLFHHNVAKLDIQKAVAFLCTRVRSHIPMTTKNSPMLCDTYRELCKSPSRSKLTT
jgi:hypothetical protein